jgi:hypothetical protein
MSDPRDEERGPFPQFQISITTENGTVRQVLFNPHHAYRIVAGATSFLVGIPFDDPYQGESGPGPGFAGHDPSEINQVTIVRADRPPA